MSGSECTKPSKITRPCSHHVPSGAPASRHRGAERPRRTAPSARSETMSAPSRIYTDGACSGNPGPGGWAWAIEDGPWASGFDEHTTNQRMEISAAFEAVIANDGPIEIVSDSTYVVNCFRDSWYVGWRKRGWLNSQKKPVANRDLWEPFIERVLERGDITFSWVKGHSTDPMNDLVDRLAVGAVLDRSGSSGVGRPSELPPADLP